MKRFKIAYVTPYDAEDISNWSGLGYYILKAIRSFADVVLIDKLVSPKIPIHHRIKGLMYKYILNKNYLYDRGINMSKFYADQIIDRLPQDVDFIFCPSTVPIAMLKSNKSIICWTDATFKGMVDFYPYFTNLCQESIIAGDYLEQEAINRAAVCIYSSTWAYNTAIFNYNANSTKLRVIPFGANLEKTKTESELFNIIQHRVETDVCKLLFIGVDWVRKGGEIAIKVVEKLNRKGIRTELHVVGIKDFKKEFASYVINHGFLEKSNLEHEAKLESLFINSHFLILPSKAECFGVVFCEASSFGLPSLASNVGGISSAIQNEVNGHTFDLGAVDEYVNYIESNFLNKTRYKNLSMSSYKLFKENLNWEIISKRIQETLREVNVNKY